MHNDIHPTQEQNTCQLWSRHIYRAKTGTGRRPWGWLGPCCPEICASGKNKMWHCSGGQRGV